MSNPSVPSVGDGPHHGDAAEDLLPENGNVGSGGEAVDPSGDGAASAGSAPRSRRRRWIWTAVVLSVLAVLVGVAFIPTPYYLFQPGSVRPAETRIDVTGASAYETKGDVLFTTVYVDQASLALLARGWLDDAVEIRTEEEVYGPEGRDASRKANQQRMDLSKLIATKVALDYLGQPAEFTAHGARVLGLAKDGPSVGKLRVGDVITSVDGHEISLPADIQEALAGRSPGEVVPVVAERGDGKATKTVEETITLGSARSADDSGATSTTSTPERSGAPSGPATDHVVDGTDGTDGTDGPGEADAGGTGAGTSDAAPRTRPILGVSVEPHDPSVSSPVHVEIDSGDVTGPSAGLAWSLAVVDRLTPGSLTDGRDVAVTGEILSDGSVGPIGGIVQKVAAVKRAGVHKFLYPASTEDAEQRQMRRLAGDEVELVPVATLAEAVEALHPGGVRMNG